MPLRQDIDERSAINVDRHIMNKALECIMKTGSDRLLSPFKKLGQTVYASRTILVRYIASTGCMAVGLIAHTVGFIILAKTLGAAQFGVLAIITAAANFGLLWSGLGSGELVRRRVARDRSTYSDVFGHALVILIGSSATIGVAVAAGLAVSVKIDDDLSGNLLIMMLFVMSNMGLFSWINLTEQILIAHGDMGKANIVNMSTGIGRALAAVFGCWVWGISELQQWVWWHFGFYLVISVACFGMIARYGRPRLNVMWRDLARGLTLTASGFLGFLRRNADVLVLGAVASPSVVGAYSVARKIVGTADVVSASLDRVVYSSFAIAGAAGPSATLRLAVKYAAASAVLCGTASLALFLTATWIVWIFGDQYADAIHMTLFLAWTLILTSLHNLASDALNAAEQHEMRLTADAAAGAIGTCVMIGLTMTYGLYGILLAAYIGGALSVVALWSMLVWLTRRDARWRLDSTSGICRLGEISRSGQSNDMEVGSAPTPTRLTSRMRQP